VTAADLFAAALRAASWDEYHRLITAAQVADLNERARILGRP